MKKQANALAALIIMWGGAALTSPDSAEAAVTDDGCYFGSVPANDPCFWCGSMPGCELTGCHSDPMYNSCSCLWEC